MTLLPTTGSLLRVTVKVTQPEARRGDDPGSGGERVNRMKVAGMIRVEIIELLKQQSRLRSMIELVRTRSFNFRSYSLNYFLARKRPLVRLD